MQSGRSPGVGNVNLLQYSCLENSMDKGAWWGTVHGGHKESDTTEQLSPRTHIHNLPRENCGRETDFGSTIKAPWKQN